MISFFQDCIKSFITFLTLIFFSISVFAFSPLDPFLWPDPDFQPKLDLIKYKHFKKPRGAYSVEGELSKRITFKGTPSQENLKSLKIHLR